MNEVSQVEFVLLLVCIKQLMCINWSEFPSFVLGDVADGQQR